MKKYSELGHVYRTEPCEEYPGTWHVYAADGEEHSFTTFGGALVDASLRLGRVCWEASEDDPRIGEVWFTGFYCHGWYDSYGTYRTDDYDLHDTTPCPPPDGVQDEA